MTDIERTIYYLTVAISGISSGNNNDYLYNTNALEANRKSYPKFGVNSYSLLVIWNGVNMLFSYDSAIRECKRINENGGRSRPKKVWYGWIIVDV